MKLIFLDFDGVLNNRKSRHVLGWNKLDPAAVALVNELVDTTGAEIVVSSSWRIGKPVERLQRILAENGFHGQVRDVTPYHRCRCEPRHEEVRRGCEIHAYLLDNPADRFVIIDDDSDMYHLVPNLVQTKDVTGLTRGDVERAIEVLR